MTVTVDPAAADWLKFVQTKALSSGKLEFSVSTNKTTDERSAKVTVSDSGGKAAPVEIVIKQEAMKVLETGEINVIPAEGGTYEVVLKYNTDYTVIVELAGQSWIKLVQTKALSTANLVFEIAPNLNPESRTARAYVSATNLDADMAVITFEQEGATPVLSVEAPEILSGEKASFSVPIKTNTPISVNFDEQWLHYYGVQDDNLMFRVEYNFCPERKAVVTVTDDSGILDPVTFEITQDESNVRKGLMMIYNSMGKGANWDYAIANGIYEAGLRAWGTDAPYNTWEGVTSSTEGDWFHLQFIGYRGHNLEGELPDCFDLFGEKLRIFMLSEQPNVTGTIPPSFASLTNLVQFGAMNVSWTSLPDYFADMKQLTNVNLCHNFSMTGPLPEHLAQNDNMVCVWLNENDFTGEIPESYLKHAGQEHGMGGGTKLNLQGNRLTGKYPDFGKDNFRNLFALVQRKGYGFDVTGREMKAFDLKETPKDMVTGKDIVLSDVTKANKYTVVIHWTTWCTIAVTLMPKLSKLYEKYHKDGLEIVAFVSEKDRSDAPDKMETIKAKGYDKWINLDWDNMVIRNDESLYFSGITPYATVIDQEGNIVYSDLGSVYPGIIDPVGQRFIHSASSDLVPFLESLFGPYSDDDETYTSTDFSKDGEVTTIQTATVGKGINVVFMGDGYTDREIADGTYGKAMKAAADEFFAIEPYKSFRDRFNVYYVNVVSKNEICGAGFETALGSSFGSGTYIGGNVDKCYEYALKVPVITSKENLLIPVMVKTSRHAGTAHMSESLQSSVAFFANGDNDPDIFGSTLRHEANGHGFGFLDDEYVVTTGIVPEDHKASRIEQWEKYGWWANSDFTNDPAKVKWSKYLTDDRYKDAVGIFEGASTYSVGAFKPSENSMMNENLEYFNAPSREAIYKRIMTLSGEGYSFEKFLEYDAINRTPAAKAAVKAVSKAPARRAWEPTAPPVVTK